MSQGRQVVVDTKRDHGMERIHGAIQNETLTFQSRENGEKQRLRPDVIRYYTNLRIMEDPPAYGYGTLDLVDSTNLVEQQLVTPVEVATDVGLRLKRDAQEIKILNFDESATPAPKRVAPMSATAKSVGGLVGPARRKRSTETKPAASSRGSKPRRPKGKTARRRKARRRSSETS